MVKSAPSRAIFEANLSSLHPMLLTIAIPTYNRNEILARNLRPLLDQLACPELGTKCCLRIFDNASPIPVSETLAPLLREFPEVQCETVRNVANIGANANILRCFETCETPYLWVLGDDDTPLLDALSTIFGLIERFPDCVFFSYSDEKWERERAVETRGAEQFVLAMDSLWLLLCVSSSLYRADVLRNSLRVGYRFEYSHAPHLVTLLAYLNEVPAQCRLGTEQIVHWHAPAEGQQWPLVPFALGIATMLEMPMTDRARRHLAGVIAAALNLEILVLQLLLLAVRDGRREQNGPLFLFDQLCARLFYFDKNPGQRLKRLLFRRMLCAPRLSYALLSRLKGRGSSTNHHLQDLFERV